jgi:hypothetical protein
MEPGSCVARRFYDGYGTKRLEAPPGQEQIENNGRGGEEKGQ